MKWVSYYDTRNNVRGGLIFRHHVVDLALLLDSPTTTGGVQLLDIIHSVQERASIYRVVERMSKWAEQEWEGWKADHQAQVIPFDQVSLAAPLPVPHSFRDFYAFEAHVKTCRGKRGLDMVDQWYAAPAFYFSNHQSITGPNTEITFPRLSKKRDYELEIGIVIGKEGRNITRDQAFDYVFGLTIINDWSARDIQAEEVKVGLGPAKGKDFSTSVGPFLVSADEWRDRLTGEQIDLSMEAYINDKKQSSGNLNQLYFSIPQLVEQASKDCTLFPGDLLGTGTVGTGCLLEQEEPTWLQSGDRVALKVERLGVLTNTIK
ncbi:fumarylacetoacetate hydrolase family protein [Caldalkalibacillus salinus]|uniref:fumarylacetoacetate hydrolase family protein n=1 Tax=Caldalkalibacillus salinus TaxID=2803787 RepID=UPI0019208C27|nr:fumarylacetoacetate hydrolase family protein [Caldalkalibacillus salinus]